MPEEATDVGDTSAAHGTLGLSTAPGKDTWSQSDVKTAQDEGEDDDRKAHVAKYNQNVPSQEEIHGQSSISTTALDFVSALASGQFEIFTSGQLSLDDVTVRVAGRGGYATIEIGTLTQPRKHLVAVKRSLVQSELETGSPKDSKRVLGKGFEHLVRELRVLGHDQVRRHENIVRLKGICLDDFNGFPSLALAIEYTPLGTLRSFLIDHAQTLPIAERIGFVIQGGRGLEALHRLSVCHADVKIDNALVFKSPAADNGAASWVVKISDLGQSIIASRGQPEGRVPCRPGTRLLEAPEIRSGEAFLDPSYDIKAALRTDVFSFGLFAWEVLKYGHSYWDPEWAEPGALQVDMDTMEHFLNSLPADRLLWYGTEFLRHLNEPDDAESLVRLFEGTLRDSPQDRRPLSELLEDLVVPSQELPSALPPDDEANGAKSDFSFDSSDIDAILTTLGLGFDHRSSIASWGMHNSFYDIIFQGAFVGAHDVVSDLPLRLQQAIVSELKTMAFSDSSQSHSSGHSAMIVSECYTVGFGGSHDMEQVVEWLGTAASKGYRKAGLIYHRVYHALGVAPKDIVGTEHGKAIETAVGHISSEDYLPERIRFLSRQVMEAARKGILWTPCPCSAHEHEQMMMVGPDEILLSVFNEAEVDKLLPLHVASWLGEEALVLHLLQSTPPETQSALGFNAAHFACFGGRLSMLELLIKNNVPLVAASFRAITPLHLIIFFQPKDVAAAMRLLLDNGCETEAHSSEVNWEAHDLLIEGTPMQWALQTRNRGLVRLLLPLYAKSPDIVWLAVVIEYFYWELLEEILPHLQQIHNLSSQLLAVLHTSTRPYLHWIVHGRDYSQAIQKTVQLCKDNDFIGYNAEGTSQLDTLLCNLRTSTDILMFNSSLEVSSAEYVRYRKPGPYSYPLIVTAFQKTAHREGFRDLLTKLVDFYSLEELEDGSFNFAGSLLGEAVTHDNVMGARILLERGVNVNKSYTICGVIITNPMQTCLSERASPEMLSLLVEYGADLMAKSPMTGLTPLHSLIVGRTQVKDILDILSKRQQPDQVYIEALHRSFGTILLRDVRYNETSVSPGKQQSKRPRLRRDLEEQFRQLLMHSKFAPFVDCPQYEGGPTMLQQAAYLANISTVKLLLDAGADATRPFQHGNSSYAPLQLLCMTGRGLYAAREAGMANHPALEYFTMSQVMEVATELLQWHLAHGDDLFEGIVELHIACRAMDEETIAKYIERGQSMKSKGRWPGIEHLVTPRELALLPLDDNEGPLAALIPGFEDELLNQDVMDLLAGPEPELSEDDASVRTEDLEH
ncbi:hypothetical protein FGADI_13096 [Fusarium gaditjirri]|uniref:Protein kinase domain-containing protein n=1 Tax=Fusarium gaditjirri TaxID=282569 RepID=A0A8H4WNA1_9HYPO|nr:hypothetical protein FGADI_13096 [Fusarium gaditjirri]